MRKAMKLGRKYLLINIDEPYAEKIYAILKEGQMAKGEWPEGGIDFEEWKRRTFEGNSITTAGEQLEDFKIRLGNLEYKLSCLETMSKIARQDCQHDWVEELQDQFSSAGPVPRKMRCRKCLIAQYIY